MSTGVQMRINVAGKAAPDTAPGSQLGTRLPSQDYDKLRRQCLSQRKLFEDPYFPADSASLFYAEKLPFTPEWKRPSELSSDPKFMSDGISRFDVSQGLLGDCWLVAAIASLTQSELLLSNVIPNYKQLSFDKKNYFGIFRFRFWHFGEWVDIVVDDRLPSYNGKLIFMHSPDANEFWCALLEKAYAKLHGSYEALKGGKTSEAMEDFTGGLVETFDLKKADDNLFEKLLKGMKKSCLLSCSIKVTSREEMEAKLDSGLVKGHAYSITGVDEVKVRGKKVHLLRIRNPWGQKEWAGDWSDNSSTWKSVTEAERKRLHQVGKEDGEFWMCFEDVCKHFTDLEMCNISIDNLYEDDAIKNWNAIIKSGSWLSSAGTAGGCRNYPTFTKNPQYVVDLLEDDDGDGKCSCLIALMQKHRRKQKKMGAQDLCIGFSVYKAPEDGSDVLDKKYVDYHYSAGTSGSFTNAREVSARFDLEPGRYIILPCSFKPGDEGDYLLRIFTEKLSTPKDKKSDTVADKEEDPRKVQLRNMFTHLAGEDNEVDAEELQDILTASLTRDMKSSVFSIDACRSMIAMLDVDKNGTLNFEEFQNLLQTIGVWKKMFFKFDSNRSGTLEKDEVAEAIKSLNYNLSPKAFSDLFNRFAKKRLYMNLDDFAACLSRIKIMNDAFQRLSSGGKSVTLSKDEFFQVTLDA